MRIKTKKGKGIDIRDVRADEPLSFQSLISGSSKHNAAVCFLEILQLKTYGYVDAHQQAPYTDILLTPTV